MKVKTFAEQEGSDPAELSLNIIFSWAKAPALYVTMSQAVEVVEEEVHF